MGSVFITTILFVASTMISDIINAGLDPRIRENL
jgi:ABC-type dipeptide/oligopeptide/nickel transport system permease component